MEIVPVAICAELVHRTTGWAEVLGDLMSSGTRVFRECHVLEADAMLHTGQGCKRRRRCKASPNVSEAKEPGGVAVSRGYGQPAKSPRIVTTQISWNRQTGDHGDRRADRSG